MKVFSLLRNISISKRLIPNTIPNIFFTKSYKREQVKENMKGKYFTKSDVFKGVLQERTNEDKKCYSASGAESRWFDPSRAYHIKKRVSQYD